MGLILHSQQVTQHYMDSFWDDWNRLDETTDTDIDGIPDFWEVANGLSRTNQDSASIQMATDCQTSESILMDQTPILTIPMEIVFSIVMKYCGQQL